MEQTPPVVEPLNPAASQPPAVEPTAEAAAPSSGLSDELLQIPAIGALFSGQPPALSASIKDMEKGSEGKIIKAHSEELKKAGMGLYRSLDGQLGVLFNTLFVHPEEVQQADKAGQLLQLAPPFDEVNASVGKSGANNPVLNAQTPQGPKGPPAPTGISPVQIPPASPATLKSIAKSREKNLQPGAPTSGPSPGNGRLLASILKPVL